VEIKNKAYKGLFICPNGTVLSKFDRCNGKRDCLNGEDELFCNLSDGKQLKTISDTFLIDINVYPPSSIELSVSIKQKQNIGINNNPL
jgi:hypothetical protein